MSYTDNQVSSAIAAIDKYRGSETGEVGTALAIVGLSSARVAKTVTAIVGAPARSHE